MAQLGNCPKCRKLYLKIREICDECYQKQEEDFHKVAMHLREMPGDTIQEVSEATGVSVSQIIHFIATGRLQIGHFPNLTYPCQICGTSIRSGKVCKTCMDSLSQQTNANRDNKMVDDRNNKYGGYITKYL
ncbi:flagellar protein [Pullulanibacillus sp. KACC 23026]|uniref:TIGR03826 family flagellar region protein n=1 Tax=Pullulanibacillus sp. KACC 23026 TaxID=3028315 RepID=UPI0023B12046|nr:TIGR03826 family flagellar region protein [Pullulanibacillus sp. KACC 23026]WEG11262.1 flagellar protein [Pullulanibacillus sp. KACC 23026]